MKTYVSFHESGPRSSIFETFQTRSGETVVVPKVGEIVTLTKLANATKSGKVWTTGKYEVERVEHEYYLTDYGIEACSQSVAVFLKDIEDKTITIKNNDKKDYHYNYDDHNRRRDR
jgi:hypothetical protein